MSEADKWPAEEPTAIEALEAEEAEEIR